VNFHGEKRSNQTHESKSDPDAQLARKGPGKEAKLSYSGNLLVENRNGLIVDSRVWEATGTAERYAALDMLQDLPGDGNAGYRISQKKRKRIEECFGWLKTIALLRKLRHRGTLKVDWIFALACAAYNLVRLRNLMANTVLAQ
jgi:hypothetical protein